MLIAEQVSFSKVVEPAQSSKMNRPIFILAASICISGSFGVTTDYSDGDLDKIPWDTVPLDTTKLVMRNNAIQTVDDVPSTTHIRTLNLIGNLLTEFPDVRNIATTLVRLSLTSNSITKISPPELLSGLPNLKSLSLINNPIIVLPDIEYFPPPLARLTIGSTRIKTLPNFCQMDVGSKELGVLDIHDSGNMYSCDAGMVWFKLAAALGRISETANIIPSCGSPSYLVARQWSTLTLEDLLIPSRFNHSYLRQIFKYVTACRAHYNNESHQ